MDLFFRKDIEKVSRQTFFLRKTSEKLAAWGSFINSGVRRRPDLTGFQTPVLTKLYSNGQPCSLKHHSETGQVLIGQVFDDARQMGIAPAGIIRRSIRLKGIR